MSAGLARRGIPVKVGRVKPYVQLAEARLRDGTVFSLHTHDGKFYLKNDRRELMSTALTYSEQLLAELGCAALLEGQPFGQQRIIWLGSAGKAQVRDRVFMRAIDFGCVGQGCELAQRRSHLRCSAFKQAATAAGKQGVATE